MAESGDDLNSPISKLSAGLAVNALAVYALIAALSVLSVFQLQGCGRSDEIIEDENTAAAVYIDLMIAVEKNPGDIKKLKSEKNKIFKKYDVTETQFKATLEYYNQRSERWETFFTIVNTRLEEMRKKKTI